MTHVGLRLSCAAQQVELVNRLTAATKPYAYVSHVYFVNFER